MNDKYKPPRKRAISITLSQCVLEKLQLAAKKQSRSMSQVIDLMLDKELHA